jgi:hypothetical protein
MIEPSTVSAAGQSWETRPGITPHRRWNSASASSTWSLAGCRLAPSCRPRTSRVATPDRDLVRIGDVGGERTGGGPQLLRDLLAALAIDVGDDDLRTLVHEPLGGAEPDT